MKGVTDSSLIYGSVCSGIEAATVAWHPLGWRPAFFSEIEKFPRAVLKHHYPNVPLHGDFTTISEGDYEPIDLLVGGTPCFPAATIIATARGFVPIDTVQVGDQVWTHKHRYRRVVRTGHKTSKTVVVKGQGHFGLVTTANHRFLARRKTGRSTRVDGKAVRITSNGVPEWTAAENLSGAHWACVSDWPTQPTPRVETCGNERVVETSIDLMRFAGAYLGDGWASTNNRRGYVKLGINNRKLSILKPTLDAMGAWSSVQEGAAVRVQISSRALARWLIENFGSGALDKSVPMWALGIPREWREALIDGYRITDGGPTLTSGIIRATTVSRQLALTMRALAVATGYASSVGFMRRPATHVINGRTVNQKDTYTVTLSKSSRSSFADKGFRWQRVRTVTPTEHDETVYDLEVEDDHSYVADGICVHNCQSFSIAGLRGGLDDDRGNLALEYLRLADRLRPRWLVWENVPGVLSSNGGRDFGAILGGMVELGYGFAYRVLDAQYVRVDGFARAVPQRRRRVFVVGYFGDWRRAAAALFDSESLRGGSAPIRRAGESVAPTLSARTKGGGGLGTDFECDGGLIASTGDVSHCLNSGNMNRLDFTTETMVAHTLRGEGFDASEDGTGRGTPLVPVYSTSIQGVALRGRDGGGGDKAYVLAPIAFDETQITSKENRSNPQPGDPSHPLAAGAHPPTIAYRTTGNDGCYETGDVAPCLGTGTDSSHTALLQNWRVRRLTPIECERLQGFPDNYSQVPGAVRGGWRDVDKTEDLEELRDIGLPLRLKGNTWRVQDPDSPRYKALGNSMAVNCMRWIGRRIALVDKM